MNNKVITLLKNFAYTIISNFLTLAISAILVLLAPKVIGVKEYGYWQLYLFFSSYIGIFHFGWLDGIYLRYGGEEYNKLDKQLFFSQFMELTVFQIIIAVIIAIYAAFAQDPNRSYIFLMTAIVLVVGNLGQYFTFIFQLTNRIKEFSLVNAAGRIVYFLVVLSLVIFRYQHFEMYVVADLIGRIFTLLYGMYLCKDLLLVSFSKFRFYYSEIQENIRVGIKLVAANFAGMLVIGIVRYGIQSNWSVATFGKLSLTLNFSNFLMTFVSSISLVLYPMLRRIEPDKLKRIYDALLKSVDAVLLLSLILYYPIYLILPRWLPAYADSFKYMAMLFPMVVYNGKFNLLTMTFMKTYRFEKDLLSVNLITVFISFVITAITAYVIKDINLVVLSIIVILFLQNTIGELILSRRIGIKMSNNLILETCVVSTFIGANWYLSNTLGFLLFILVYGLYLIISRNQIKSGLTDLKLLMK